MSLNRTAVAMADKYEQYHLNVSPLTVSLLRWRSNVDRIFFFQTVSKTQHKIFSHYKHLWLNFAFSFFQTDLFLSVHFCFVEVCEYLEFNLFVTPIRRIEEKKISNITVELHPSWIIPIVTISYSSLFAEFIYSFYLSNGWHTFGEYFWWKRKAH